MTSYARYLPVFVSLAAGLVLGAGGIGHAAQSIFRGPPPPPGVFDAIPVTPVGTTTVSGTLQAEQRGTWNVGITGTPTVALANNSVHISNGDGSPIPVRVTSGGAASQGETVVRVVCLPGTAGADAGYASNCPVDIPKGKQLVIDMYSAQASRNTVGTLTITRPFVDDTHPAADHYTSTLGWLWIPVPNQAAGVELSGALQPMHFVLDSSESISLSFDAAPMNLVLFGHLLDAPQVQP